MNPNQMQHEYTVDVNDRQHKVRTQHNNYQIKSQSNNLIHPSKQWALNSALALNQIEHEQQLNARSG